MSKILITGVAGFIGSQLANKLINRYDILGIDIFNNYYDPRIKEENIKKLTKRKKFHLFREDIRNKTGIIEIIKKIKPDIIIHLAARCGTRDSITQKPLYFSVNVEGTRNILDAAVASNVSKVLFASSSSVYGNSTSLPFREDAMNLKQMNPYGKSKFLAEKLCQEYMRKYQLPITVFRFFTVYGPHGRPDMAPYIFTKAILSGSPITIFGNGLSKRDYTYITDIINALDLAVNKKNTGEIINLGNSSPITLIEFIRLIEKNAGRKAKIKTVKENPFEMKNTYADIEKAKKLLGWKPQVPIEEGVSKLVSWMKKEVL